MICIKCKSESVFNSLGISLCKGHFNEYVFGKVDKTLKKFKISKKSKILVALSGGKDSVNCLYLLKKLYFENIEAIHIKTDFGFYSEKSYKYSRRIAEILDIKLNVLDLSKGLDISVSKLIDSQKKNPCNVCSTVRRYFLNKFAFENKFEFIATGHTLSDVINQMMNNVKNNFLLGFKNLSPVLFGDEKLKLVARLKPLFFVSDLENKIFLKMNKIPYYSGKCPYFKDKTFKKYINKMEKDRREDLNKMAYSLIQMSRFFYDLKELKIETKNCKICGYPGVSEICKFCRLFSSC